MCVFAMLGGEQGVKLTRAAFSVMLKFSDSVESFVKLVGVIEKTTNEIDDALNSEQTVKSIAIELKEEPNQNYLDLLKLWEQASLMRKWTQKVKLNLSERVKADVERKFRKEITQANPSQEPFTGQFSEEQKAKVEERFDEQFDREVKAKYDEVAKKASFLVKLSIPQVFKDAKKDLLMDKIATGFTSQFGASLDILKNRSITPSLSNKSLSRTALSRRGSVDSAETMSMTKMSTFK